MKHVVRLMVMTLLAAPSLGQAAVPVQFFCTVSGAAMLKPKIAPEAICSRFKLGIEADNSLKMQPIAALPKANSSATRLLKIDVTFRKPGIASAIVTQQDRKKIKTYPEISIAVSDRAMDMGTIEQLVHEVTRMIRQ